MFRVGLTAEPENVFPVRARVFPGVFPFAKPYSTPINCIPRESGGVSGKRTISSSIYVFPVRAGVFLDKWTQVRRIGRIPRESGGVSQKSE